MDTDWIVLTSFVVVTNFTPGPNNISSASMGILYGYRGATRYLVGISTGFALVMLLCGWVSSGLLQIFPAFEKTLRIIGALYILWLAYHTLKASYAFDEDQQVRLGFSKGFILQLLNPKVIVYGLTLYATFLGEVIFTPIALFISSLVFALVAFCAASTWTLFGASIRTYMNRPRVKQGLNTALSLLLVYTAVELSGVLDYLFA